jgi:hypothetical protein
MVAEFEAVMLAIEAAVRACILRERWEDLPAAVTEYAALVRLDPSYLLRATLIRLKVWEVLTQTDPDQQRYHAEQLRVSIELAARPMPLEQAVANLRSAVEHRPAFDAFDALGRKELPTGVLH